MSSACAIAAFLLPIVTPCFALQANTTKIRKPVAGVLPYMTVSSPGRHPKTMIFSGDGQTLAVAYSGQGYPVRLYDVQSGQLKRELVHTIGL